MAKNRGWVCNTCGTLIIKIGKGFRKAHEEHKKKCIGDKNGNCTYSIQNTVKSSSSKGK